jgi:FAD dependent oxidoreductase
MIQRNKAGWLVFLIAICSQSAFSAPSKSMIADVVIYGGTPAGLAAATAVVRAKKTVIIIEPTTHIGGMITGGIAVTDTGTPQFVGGISREFFQSVATAEAPRREEKHNIEFRGNVIPWYEPAPWDVEAKVAKQIFGEWVLSEKYPIIMGEKIVGVRKSGTRILSLKLTNGCIVSGKAFIDASYEGDLMARAGVSYTFGRESSAEYGEKLAGIRDPHFIRNYTPEQYATPTREYMHHGQFGADLPARQGGELLWGVEPGPLGTVGAADKRLQAYCYRLIATQRKDLKIDWWKPDHYDAAHYDVLLRYLQRHPEITFTRLVHLGPIPGGKWDLNASGPFSIDFVGGNSNYPELDYKKREEMLQAHKDYEQGFFWFLAHDPRVPKQLQSEVQSWGPAKDEWVDNGNWPTQIYIREARRMIGSYVMTEKDIVVDKTKQDSVGLGSFVLDSHWVRRLENKDGFIRVEGHLDESIDLSKAPYEIPYRSLVPKQEEVQNLLVPVDLSASHVAICTIRMEPVYMILGQSAGVAAALAIESGKSVQTIDVNLLTSRLRSAGQILHQEQAVSIAKP